MAEPTAAPNRNDFPSSSTASSSASTSDNYYDVFISYCGEDTDAGTFAGELSSRLFSRGLYAFLPNLKFRSVENVTSQLEAVISLASVQIVILSPNYAKWKWCLDALDYMIKSEVTILPVFYKVKPSQVRWTGKDKDGRYAELLRDHEEKEPYGSQTVQNWRDVLSRVSEISGIEVKTCKGDEEEPFDKVVDSVFHVCPHLHYDVFINHRGSDTKEEFAEPLYNRLCKHGLRVFLDRPELKKGLKITSQIEIALQFASVHIAIFSREYARSNWCLDELYLMTMSRATILPVFYEVEPSVLDGGYDDDLARYEGSRYDAETIEKWRGALLDVSKITEQRRFELKGNNAEELSKNKEELLNLIVRSVLENVPKRWPGVQSSESESAVKCILTGNDPSGSKVIQKEAEPYLGWKKKLEDLEKVVLSKREEKRGVPKVVGIVGDGGVGKTTLAKEFLKCKKSEYGESCFFGFRERAGRSGPRESLEKVLRQINDSSPYGSLLILDDVDDLIFNDDDVGDKDVYEPDAFTVLLNKYVSNRKSLILVTSSNEDVLKRLDSSIYCLTRLNDSHSRRLFCSHAFFRGYPVGGFTNLIEKFVTACNGLPLLLKVLGASLCGKAISFWQKKLNELPKQPAEIDHILKICYDSLNPEDQQIFLDIACFFEEADRDKPIRIWGEAGLKELENRCLLEVDGKNEIKMHDHLKELGRNIAKGLMARRLRDQTTKNIVDLLKQSSSELFQFRGIMMTPSVDAPDIEAIPEEGFSHEFKGSFAFEDSRDETESEMPYSKPRRKMLPDHTRKAVDYDRSGGPRNLKIVAAQDGYLEDILRVGSPDLIWLRWYKCPYTYLPSRIPMENLRVLEVDGSKLKELWRDESEAPLSLRELNIFAPLSVIPTSIAQLIHLEKVVVNSSPSHPPGIKSLPEEFCLLRSLKYLELRKCSSMRSLPDSFGRLTNLQYIDLEGASSLRMLPDSFGRLINLQYIDLEGASSLRMLPDSFGELTNLQYIELKGASSLQMLPKSFWGLTLLKHLSLGECGQIQDLRGVEHLTSLETLDIRRCKNLQNLKIIQGLQNLTRLQTVNISGCSKILYTGGFDQLTVERLYAGGCSRFLSIQRLKPLQTLYIDRDGYISKLSYLASNMYLDGDHLMRGLHLMHRRGAYRRWDVRPDAYCSPTPLTMLHVGEYVTMLHDRKCENLWSIQSDAYCSPTPLTMLHVGECENLWSIQGLEYLRDLEILDIRGCWKMEALPGLQHLTSLKELYAEECEKLESLTGLRFLKSLKTLSIGQCREIRELAGLGHLSSLYKLAAEGCEKLESIENLKQLRGLQTLNVSGCCKILALPGVEYLTSLETLDVGGCEKLESIENLEQLRGLRILNVSGCRKIPALPGVEYLTSLMTLDVRGCEKLESIENLEQLRGLQTLNVSGCRKILALPGVEYLTSLETLDVGGCKKLESIENLEQLRGLRILNVSECRKILVLPGVEYLTSLETLDVRGCKKLESIPPLSRLKELVVLYIGGSLMTLNVKHCTNLWRIEGLAQLTKLRTLNVSGCSHIESLPGLQHLTSLETLCANGCSKLNSIEGLGQLTKLRTLDVSHCSQLPALSDLEHLTSLETLDVSQCGMLQSIQGLTQLTELRTLCVAYCPKMETLDIKRCQNLQRIEGLGQLSKLRTLIVADCPEIQKLPCAELEKQFWDVEKHLTFLDVKNCQKLVSIEGLGQLTKLRELYVHDCREIEELADVEHLTSLETLDLNGCEKLPSILRLRQLTNLREIKIINCRELGQLPGMEHLTSLEKLDVRECDNLQGIQGLGQLTNLKELFVIECHELQELV